MRYWVCSFSFLFLGTDSSGCRCSRVQILAIGLHCLSSLTICGKKIIFKIQPRILLQKLFLKKKCHNKTCGKIVEIKKVPQLFSSERETVKKFPKALDLQSAFMTFTFNRTKPKSLLFSNILPFFTCSQCNSNFLLPKQLLFLIVMSFTVI